MWSRILLEKPTIPELVKQFPQLLNPNVDTAARHVPSPWATLIHYTPFPTTSFHRLTLSLSSGLTHSGFNNKIPYELLPTPFYVTHSAHITFLHFGARTMFSEQQKSQSCSWKWCLVTFNLGWSPTWCTKFLFIYI